MKAIKATKKTAEKLTVLDVSIEKPFSAMEVFEQVKEEILNGKTDVLKAFLFFHQMGAILEQFKKDKHLKDALENLVSKLDSPLYGFEPSVKTKKAFDYTVCNDEYLNVLNGDMKILKEAIKEREQFLQFHEDHDKRPTFTYSTYVEIKKAA